MLDTVRGGVLYIYDNTFKETELMVDMTTYTTSELERLSTLNRVSAKIGEYITIDYTPGWCKEGALLRTNDALVHSNGRTWKPGSPTIAPYRRVRSFTDLTELDPSVEAMRGELERRKAMDAAAATFKVGDKVRYDSGDYYASTDNWTVHAIDTRSNGGTTLSLSGAVVISGIDPREVSPMPTPQPVPGQVYRHKNTTDETAYGCNLYRFVDGRIEVQNRPASPWTRSMCYDVREFAKVVASGERVPYTPPVISNATHAGRRALVEGAFYADGRTHQTQQGRILDTRGERITRAGLDTLLRSYKREGIVVVALDNGALVAPRVELITLLD